MRPVWLDHLPAEHRLSQTLAEVWAVPEVENLPAAQALQTLAEVWAVPEVEYWPATQAEQTLANV